MTCITFNPLYTLKPDDGRALILARLMGRNLLKGIDDSFTNAIHPIYAMILSHIDGDEKDSCIIRAAEHLGTEKDLVEKFVNSLIDNPNQVLLKGKDGISTFPPFSIVSLSRRKIEHRYNPEQFDFDHADVTMKRHLTPSTLTLMVNNVCVTDCVYCYQDKSKIANCTIPLKRIIELIHEAKTLNVNTFDVIGGEFFLYRHWKQVLTELRKYGYNPYLSTKMPITRDIAQTLANLKVRDIQISLDTLIEQHLIDSIGVDTGYAENVKQGLRLLNEYGIPVMIHSVLTRHNDTINDMQSIYEEIKTMQNVIDWHIVKGDPSLYPRTPYPEIEISNSNLSTISNYLNSLTLSAPFPIRAPYAANNDTITTGTNDFEKNGIETPHEEAFFSNRTFCSGLFSALYILPDGKVTMCEQLYWNPHFIIGDIMKDNIVDIWNSDKAKRLFFIRQDDIPQDSLCHTCSRFNDCRYLRQVCYREIVKKYGSNHWYYPDVNCPFMEQI